MSIVLVPRTPYNGPEFDEFCISHGGYLPATRDRRECVTCPLSNLCQVGFEKQVELVQNGKDPSLTKNCLLSEEDLTSESLLHGLTVEQQIFVRRHIPGLDKETQNGQ